MEDVTVPIQLHAKFSQYPFKPELNSYFERIGYLGSHSPTLANLRAIQKCHLFAIPFENVALHADFGSKDDKELRSQNPLERICVDPHLIQKKLLSNHRGGYCFEQNVYLFYVLLSMGYRVTPLLARVYKGKPRMDTTPGQTHFLIRVDLLESNDQSNAGTGTCADATSVRNASYIVDVAFGSMSPTFPLLLEDWIEQTPSSSISLDDKSKEIDSIIMFPEQRRLERFHNGCFDQYMHQLWIHDEWFDLYAFTLQEAAPADMYQGNWFVSTHPGSVFTNNLMASKFEVDSECVNGGTKNRIMNVHVHTIFNRLFSTRSIQRVGDSSDNISGGDSGGAETESSGVVKTVVRKTARTLESSEELREVLNTYFGMHLPRDVRFETSPFEGWRELPQPDPNAPRGKAFV